jgi:hypothetical protein
MDKPLAGPVRAFRDRYVASFGGLSYDLAPRAIGVHPARIVSVPELAGRSVLVHGEAPLPSRLAPRPAFHVVVLDHLMRNARELTEQGGVVFSTFDLEDPDVASILAQLDRGDPVFLNSAFSLLPDVVVRRPGDRVAS